MLEFEVMTCRDFFRHAALFTVAFWMCVLLFVPAVIAGVCSGLWTVTRKDFPHAE